MERCATEVSELTKDTYEKPIQTMPEAEAMRDDLKNKKKYSEPLEI